MSDRTAVEAAARRWVARYETAWASNEQADIRALFTDGATYRTAPFRDPWRGADGIVDGWIDRADTPGSYTFTWDIIGIDDDRVFVQGETVYAPGASGEPAERYSNLWVIDLEDDGRARAFTESWMQQ